MVLFITLYKVIVTTSSVDEILVSMTIQTRVAEKFFPGQVTGYSMVLHGVQGKISREINII